MKYSVVQCVNGNYSVVSEGHDESAAKKAFWNLCVTLENAPDVVTGTCAIFDEKLNTYAGFNQSFSHPAPEQSNQNNQNNQNNQPQGE